MYRVEEARNRSADSGCTEVFSEEPRSRTHEEIKIGGCFTVDETSAFQSVHIAAVVSIAKIEENIPENRKILRGSLNRRRKCLEQSSSAVNVTGNEADSDFIASNRMLTCPSPLLMRERRGDKT